MKKTPLEHWIQEKITPHEDLAAYQLEKLKSTLALARARSPFYAERLREVNPEEIQSLDDLAKIPFTTPGDLAREGGRMLCVGQDEISRVVTLQSTSTTGPAKRVFFTPEDQELTRDFFNVGMQTLTQPGQKVLILLPGETPGGIGQLLAGALLRIPAQPIPFGVVTGENAAEVEQLILAEGVGVIVGIPWQLLRLAEGPLAPVIKATGRLTSVLFATDYVPGPMAERIRRAWGCETYEHYGMTETGLGGGVNCGGATGYHLREADLFFEVVHPDAGVPLPAGEEGELVFTTLTRRGMPLIRYRTGDRAAFSTAPCPCGSGLRVLNKVSGRARDFFKLPGGEECSLAALDEILFALPGLLDYTPRFHREEGQTTMELRYAAGAGLSSKSVEEALVNALPPGTFGAGGWGLVVAPGYERAKDSKAIKKRALEE